MVDRHVPPAPRSGDGPSPYGTPHRGYRTPAPRAAAEDYDAYDEPAYGRRASGHRYEPPAQRHPADEPGYADEAYFDEEAPVAPTGRERRAQLRSQRSGKAAPKWMGAGRPQMHRLTRSRRQALVAFGSSAVVLAGVSSTMAVLLGEKDDAGKTPASGAQQTPQKAGSFANRDASFTQGVGDESDLGAGGLADTPSQAAQIALAATPRFKTPLTRDPVLHLLRRATFGPTPADIAQVKAVGIDAWIDRQLNPAAIPDPGGEAVERQYPYLGMSIAQLRGAVPEDKRGDPAMHLGRATIGRQIWTSRQLQEIMVDFWANHLNIVNPLEGGYDSRLDWDRTIIRKYAMGKFSDMLLASARHPAMMRYLDNASSDKRAVNENYGRELLELHSVGIEGGYTEKDVRNAAYVLTGRTIDRDGQFVYDPRRHYTGAVKVMGFSHKNSSAAEGLAVGDALVRYLATHPSTAKYIARKMAIRFVCDNPPGDLVQRLAQAYLQNGTSVVPMLKILFRSVEFWMGTGLKTRRPLENMVATARVLGTAPGADTDRALEGMYNTARNLGQAPLTWPTPDGFADVAGAWQSTASMLGLWNHHRGVVQGQMRGLTTPAPEALLGKQPSTVGGYIDALAQRLVFQPVTPEQKAALLRFLGTDGAARTPDMKLGGRVQHLVPLFLDSVFHGIR